MQIFFKQNIAMLAVPKTGTTALESALRSKADIQFKGRRKHMSAAAFDTYCAPFLKKAYGLTPERVAVMRDPLDHLRSWYKYRTRDALLGNKKSSAGMTFEAFVQDALRDPRLPHVNVGTQHEFLAQKTAPCPCTTFSLTKICRCCLASSQRGLAARSPCPRPMLRHRSKPQSAPRPRHASRPCAPKITRFMSACALRAGTYSSNTAENRPKALANMA